jgi:hypothetical protein
MLRRNSKASRIVNSHAIPQYLWDADTGPDPSARKRILPPPLLHLVRRLKKVFSRSKLGILRTLNLPAHELASCRSCFNLGFHHWPYSIVLLNILETARQGCNTCRFVKNSIISCTTSSERAQIVAIVPTWYDRQVEMNWLSLMVEKAEHGIEVPGNRINIYLFTTPGSVTPSFDVLT